MATPQLSTKIAKFGVCIPRADYEALASAPGELTWRQLAQEAIKAKAQELRAQTQKAPTENDPISA